MRKDLCPEDVVHVSCDGGKHSEFIHIHNVMIRTVGRPGNTEVFTVTVQLSPCRDRGTVHNQTCYVMLNRGVSDLLCTLAKSHLLIKQSPEP